ncbi:MAG: GDP-mannose 4,6-dehydratase, partial [Muribaculaceae bacterium]|nr:GDP-mannose 4,6-dehydratase [Muribaculaceae bacterium]
HTYGPRQSARAIIPTIISQIANGAREIMVGDLTPTRDFNFVADTCRGFLALAEAEGVEGEVFNISTGTEISMGDTLRLIAGLMGAPETRYVVDPQRLRPGNSEVFRLCGDNSRITAATPWRPQVGIEEGLRQTIAWFTDPENLARYKSNIYNR